METLSESDPGVRFEIVTSVPSWFFQDSVSAPYAYHRVITDIGHVQKNAFQADHEDTLRALNDFFPLEPSLIEHLAETIRALKCDLIVCDIAPMGILIAKEAQIPSILVENFTWDWIYQQYTVSNEHIKRHIDYLQPIFNAVDYHIQTEPICCHHLADLTTAPVSRKIKSTGAEIRQRLGLPGNVKMVLITNASMFHRPHVQEGLRILDAHHGEIWAKLEAGTEEYFKKIDRTPIGFRQILDNITAAARIRPIVIQSLFMRAEGELPSDAELDAFCDRLCEITQAGGRLKLVQVYTVARRPAESFVAPLSNAEVDAIADRVRTRTGLPTAAFYGAT